MVSIEEPNKSMRRVAIFGGQGTKPLCSSEVTAVLRKLIATSTSASLLLSRCHSALLEDLGNEDLWVQFGIDAKDFLFAEALINPPACYQNHPVLEAAILCLHQLLAYLLRIENNENGFEKTFTSLTEATGFCAGQLVAAVVAASGTERTFVSFGVQAFRLSLAIACRLTLHCLSISGKGVSASPWLLVVRGMRIEDINYEISRLHATGSSTVRLATVSGPELASVSGLPKELGLLQNQLHGHVLATTANVHTWYHGGEEQLGTILYEIVADIKQREIHFPTFADLRRPIRCTATSDLCQAIVPCGASPNNEELDVVMIKGLLFNQVNWRRTSEAILSSSSDCSLVTQLNMYGPGTGSLLAVFNNHKADLSINDVSLSCEARKLTPEISDRDIAIVGMCINLPGGKDTQELWTTLINGESAIKEVPKDRFELNDYQGYGDRKDSRWMKARHGGFLDNIWSFDNEFFSISPREALSMDPQQRLLLQATQAALDDAGYVRNATSAFQADSMGCYIGVATGDYVDNLRHSIDAYYSPGTLRAFHSGRISFVNKLGGPCMTLDTACSSSLASIHQACRAIQSGDCRSAISGGVNTISSPDMYIGLDKGHFLSKTGGCKSFDAAADGYSRAEGCVIFILKSLSDAIKENDRIYAVIRETAVNQSGNASSITHPDSDSQAHLLKLLLSRAGLRPSSIDVVEAHGTGTQAGDRQELASLQSVLGAYRTPVDPLIVSSIKGAVGHCEAASGAAGLAKLILMLRHKAIPPQAGLEHVNSSLSGIRSGQILVPSKSQTWTNRHGGPRRAILNNFGAAGSNVALLLEEHNSVRFAEGKEFSAYLFTLSAKSCDALQRAVFNHIEYLKTSSAPIRDICYTSTARRPLYERRFAISCGSVEVLLQKLEQFNTNSDFRANVCENLIFVFSGQGATYNGMAAELMQTSKTFRKYACQCDAILRNLGYPSIIGYLEGSTSAEDNLVAQCATVALEYSLAMLLVSWNIHPSFVLGHSLGEYAALAFTQALSLEDIMHTVAERSILMEKYAKLDTGMTAVTATADQIKPLLTSAPGSSIACYNSRNSFVVAGRKKTLDSVEAMCQQRCIKTKRLDVSHGFHSPAMDPVISHMNGSTGSLRWSDPKTPLVSTVTGQIIRTAREFPHHYLTRHMREPVRFMDAVEALRAEGALKASICLEIGPHPITLPMLHGNSPTHCIPTLQRDKSNWMALCASLERLSPIAAEIRWREVFSSSQARLIDLPAYPLCGRTFQVLYKDIWKGSAPELPTKTELFNEIISINNGYAFKTNMDLLGCHIDGHQVAGIAICPASLMYELAMESSQQVLKPADCEMLLVEEMCFHRSLIYKDGDRRLVTVNVAPADALKHTRFKISVQNELGEAEVCSGTVSVADTQSTRRAWSCHGDLIKEQAIQLTSTYYTRFQSRILYDMVFTRVVTYSKDYQCLIDFTVSESNLEGFGTFRVPTAKDLKAIPAMIRWEDVLLHAPGFMANLHVDNDQICICSRVGSIQILRSAVDLQATYNIYCRMSSQSNDKYTAETVVTDSTGGTVALCHGAEFHCMELKQLQRLLQAGLVDVHKPAKSSIDDIERIGLTKEDRHSSIDIWNPKEYEEMLYSTICEICLAERTKLHANSKLGEIGIDSMLQIELVHRLKISFPHIKISQDVVADCLTIGDLNEILGTTSCSAERSHSSLSSSTIQENSTSAETSNTLDSELSDYTQLKVHDSPLRARLSSGNHLPLVLFHDGSGSDSQYHRLSELDRDLHTFSRPNMLSSPSEFSSIQRMAHAYLEWLPHFDHHQIILGGWSFGGVVALEAAYQLWTRGFTIQGLVLIDSPYPGNHTPLPAAILHHVLPVGEGATSSAILREFQHNASLLASYSPPKDLPPVKAVILQSQQTIDTERRCGVRYEWLCDQAARDRSVENWRSLLGSNTQVRPIPGNHFEPFSAQYIADTTSQVGSACRYLEGG